MTTKSPFGQDGAVSHFVDDVNEWKDAGGLSQYVGTPTVKVDAIGGSVQGIKDWAAANPIPAAVVGIGALALLVKLVK